MSSPPPPPGTYTCPVCGYDRLPSQPYYGGDGVWGASFSQCPCCGTEFGFHDDPAASGIEVPFAGNRDADPEGFRQAAFRNLRARWVAGGMRWYDHDVPPPPHWDPVEQLRRLHDEGTRD